MTAKLTDDANVSAFCIAAERFCFACEDIPADADKWCENMLKALASLYLAANDALHFDVLDDDPDIEEPIDVSDGEWRVVFEQIGSILGIRRYYSTIYPGGLASDHSEPIVGDLADDLADIYRDVCPVHRASRHGHQATLRSALFDSITALFPTHWGIHAVEAMRELHVIVYLSGLGAAT